MTRTLHLAPGLTFRQTDTGWYMIDWDGRAVSEDELKRAVDVLEAHMAAHHPPAATGPARSTEDHFRTAEEALADLKRHRGG